LAVAAQTMEACGCGNFTCEQAMNVIIIETAFLGDAIISLGLAHEIKRQEPAARVTYLVRHGIEEVIASSPDVDQVITFDKYGSERGMVGISAKADELNKYGFDTLFLLHASRRSQALAARIGCNIKIGFQAMTHAALTHLVSDEGWSDRYERAILLLRAIVPETDIRTLPRVIPPAAPLLLPFLSRWKKIVALAPGSAWETKKWGNEKFFELTKALTGRGIGVIVIGGEEERALAMNIRDANAENMVLDLAGRASFVVSMAAIQRASLLVANDSAPVHAAVAVGTRVLAIFGPTIPAFGFVPPAPKAEVIELPQLWCRPCTPHGSKECPIYTHECMEGIGVSEVLERIMGSL
jgi:heptosyltransferase-2